MLTDIEPKNKQVESQSKSRDIKEGHDRVDKGDSQLKSKRIKVGNEIGRESVSIGNNEFLRNEAGTKKKNRSWGYKIEVEEVANGPHKAKGKTQGRKWKLQARATKIERGGTSGPINVKRPNSEVVWPSPESKKMRVSSPIK